MHLLAQIGGYAVCALVLFFLGCICLVNRGMKRAPLLEDDQVTPEKPFAAGAAPSAPEVAIEAPTLPPLYKLITPDRPVFESDAERLGLALAAEKMRRIFAAMDRDMVIADEIEAMISKVKEGDPR